MKHHYTLGMCSLWTALALFSGCPPPGPPSPAPIPIPAIETSPPLVRPPASFYRLTIFQDGEPWTFQCLVYDTLFSFQFCHAESIQIAVAACNAFGQCGVPVYSDVYHVGPESTQVELHTSTGTDYNWLALKYLNGLVMASDLRDYIQTHTSPPCQCYTVSVWNAQSQTYSHFVTVPIDVGDFPLVAPAAYRVEVSCDAVLEFSEYGCGIEKWRWRATK